MNWTVRVVTCALLIGCKSPTAATPDGENVGDAAAPYAVTIAVDRTRSGIALSSSFAGLSYEKSMMTTPYFSSTNTDLVGLVRRLGGGGVVRIGGNSVDATEWNHTGPGLTAHEVGPPDIDRLAGFLRATGWKALYGIDFITSHASAGAAEASYVATSLGDRLDRFEIGNEPNDYAKNGDKSSTYGYTDFCADWVPFATAIDAAVPGAALSGPGSSGFSAETSYTIPFAADEGTLIDQLSQHYYVGAGTDPSSTISKMLAPDPQLAGNLTELATASHGLGGFRITEANSFASGGVPGVSDTFASALWSIDFLFEVAQAGGVGVNFHGGKNVYSPIAIDDATNVVGVQPLYYGILLFDAAADGTLLGTNVTGNASALSAYAVDEVDATTVAVVVNKSADETIDVAIDFGRPVGVTSVLTLSAPALDSTTGVELGGASVGIDGTWTPVAMPAAVTGSIATFVLAPGSAALVRAQ